MPETTKFMTDGVGNGFPFCCPKIDMNDLGADGSGDAATFWITLGGNKKGETVDPEKYGLSQAMKFYWNFYSASGTAEHSMAWVSPPPYEADGTASLSSANVDDDTIEGTPRPEPKDRVFLSESRFLKNDSDGSANSVILRNPITYDPVWDGEPIVRMYDGDISDEDNFVGYGFYSYPYVSFEVIYQEAAISFFTGYPAANLPSEEGYSTTVNLQSFTAWDIDPNDIDIAYTLIDDMHFTCLAASTYYGAATLDAANRTASLNITIPTGPYARTETHTNTIDSLEFYTYPA